MPKKLASLATLTSEHPAEDGLARLLVALADDQMVEGVLLPCGGCAVGCVFCMINTTSLIRQMGMGEPAHNLDNVRKAIDLLGTVGNIGHKNLVFSAVGDPRVFKALPAVRVKPALALSLHTTKANLRERLIPRAPRIAPDELVALGESYARATDYPIQYQWTLLSGINDGDDEGEGLVRLLSGKYAILNMIPHNAVPKLPFTRPSWEKAADLACRLHRRGILTKLRQSAEQDVETVAASFEHGQKRQPSG